MSKFEQFYKSIRTVSVEKAAHSAKWDSCIAQVQNGRSDADPYAVCTAMLGTEAFKSMDNNSFKDKIKFYMQKLGIAGAGPVPNSLMASQDLEPTTEKSIQKSTDIQNFSVWYYDKSGAQKCAVFNNITDAEAFAKLVEVMGFNNIQIMKGIDEPTKDLVDSIKQIQVRRQQAEVNSRTQSTKSFKNFWAKLIN